jgi:hypothetical protein
VSEKIQALEDVYNSAEHYREMQLATRRARESFLDAIMVARDAKATQQQIAERCVVEPDTTKHLSRQRVAQLMNERRPVETESEDC